MKLVSNDLFESRRSCVLSTKGMVASSQNLASMAGVEILSSGGNAADAAIATAAALQVTQPCSTGLGGDCFVLYFDKESHKVHALNGSGRSGSRLNLERMLKEGFKGRIPMNHAYTVTIPGAPAAWIDFHTRFGRLPFKQVLAPAIRLAENGFPVSPFTSIWWQEGAETQLSKHRNGHELMIDGRGPKTGEIMVLPEMASSLKLLADQGKQPFYQGSVAERIITAVNEAGGDLVMEDFASHQSEWVDPIGLSFQGKTVWECPPNGQGLSALIALNALRFSDLAEPGSVLRYHQLIEAMRIGFADAAAYICDPAFNKIPVSSLLSEEYGKERASGINLNKTTVPEPGQFTDPASAGTDTVYFCTADGEGNACSFINSNFMGFGSGIVPKGCGYSLQNRGYGFVLKKGHPNVIEPGKRPYHTIIPGMITDEDNGLFAAFGVMGGMMQPQGHLQVVTSLIHDKLDPQAALDKSRFQLDLGLPDGVVLLESPLAGDINDGLNKLGHKTKILSGHQRHLFGIGQVIMRDEDSPGKSSGNVYWGGSDSRGDGCAIPQLT